MNVLVLGGNGFIGTNLCKHLLGKGYRVRSFDYMKPVTRVEGIEYIEGDFFNDAVLEKTVQGMDVVYHAICTINPGNSNQKYMIGYSRDFTQTIKLCEILEKTGAKLIFLSSGGTVYGNALKMPITEETIPHPINHYGNLKLCIENTLLTFAYQERLRVVIARISNPYGPGQDYRKGVGVIDAALQCSIIGTTMEVWGNGSVVRDYIYIDDVCNMLISLAQNNSINDYIYNVSSGRGTSVNEIVGIVRSINGKLEVNYKEARKVDAQEIVLSNTKIKEIYHYDLMEIEAGIKAFYEYLVRNVC